MNEIKEAIFREYWTLRRIAYLVNDNRRTAFLAESRGLMEGASIALNIPVDELELEAAKAQDELEERKGRV